MVALNQVWQRRPSQLPSIIPDITCNLGPAGAVTGNANSLASHQTLDGKAKHRVSNRASTTQLPTPEVAGKTTLPNHDLFV